MRDEQYPAAGGNSATDRTPIRFQDDQADAKVTRLADELRRRSPWLRGDAAERQAASGLRTTSLSADGNRRRRVQEEETADTTPKSGVHDGRQHSYRHAPRLLDNGRRYHKASHTLVCPVQYLLLCFVQYLLLCSVRYLLLRVVSIFIISAIIY